MNELDWLWWRDGVVYQIYPRSFQDSNGDGLGDLPGITSRLDYLQELGVSAIWLSPFYPSPDKDFGYDISDHCAVDARFGTLQDFDELARQSHARGIRIILDLVLNHTSDHHPWFLEARSSRDNPRRDWYIWRDKPNNWASYFGGKAWKYDPLTGQYFLHLFTQGQPDLNWRNPDVRQAQLDVVRFWLERGVDGFRLDVFNTYFKDADLRDNPARLGISTVLTQVQKYSLDQPEMLPLLVEFRSILDAQPERYSVGETEHANAQKAASYCGPDRLHAAFSFELVGFGGLGVRWNPSWIKKRFQERERAFSKPGLWPTTVTGNHDVKRPATRFSRSENDAGAKIAMFLLLTLRGTPFLYYGDEIGMRDLVLRREQVMDPVGKAYWPFMKGRDGCRSPMQWDGSPQAGFSQVEPWLMVHPDYIQRNVSSQRHAPDSIFNLTKTLIALRKQTPALLHGSLVFSATGLPGALVYIREIPGRRILCLANFKGKPLKLNISSFGSFNHFLFSTHPNRSALDGPVLTLRPYEACLLQENT